MIKIKRDNLAKLALEHYNHINGQHPFNSNWPVYKHLTILQEKYQVVEDEYLFLEKLRSDITLIDEDLESSLITCSPFLLEAKYHEYDRAYSHLLEKQSFKEQLKKAFFYNDYDKWGAYNLAEALLVDVCPYCNRSYTFTIGSDTNTGTRPHFDHYISRKLAPYLSLSFYNLVPSCYICNSSMKKDKFFSLQDYIHPYVDDYTDDLLFTIGIKEVGFIDGKADSYTIEFKRNTNSKLASAEIDRIVNTYKGFRLNEIYQKHKDYVDEIIQKSRCYTPEYVESLYSSFKTTLFQEIGDVHRMLLSNYVVLDDLEKRPLAKLTRDISNEIHVFSAILPRI